MKESLKKEFEYKLSNPVNIHKGGEKVLANKLLLRAPTAEDQKDRIILKQGIMDALSKQNAANSSDKSQTDDAKDKNEDQTKGEALISLMYVHKKPDEIIEMQASFKNLVLKRAKIDGEAVTSFIYGTLDPEEIDCMMGEYLINFILPSWIRRAMSK